MKISQAYITFTYLSSINKSITSIYHIQKYHKHVSHSLTLVISMKISQACITFTYLSNINKNITSIFPYQFIEKCTSEDIINQKETTPKIKK